MNCLVLDGTSKAERRVQAFVVVEVLNPPNDLDPCLSDARPSIILAVALAAHALNDACSLQRLGLLGAHVLGAAVEVVDQTNRGLLRSYGPPERGEA